MSITKETLDFLVENRIQNSREWFLTHKEQYQMYVKKPLIELAQQLEPTVRGLDPQLITFPSRVVSRINRDTRYTKDKSLYRDVMWCAFTRDKKQYESPCGVFIEFSPMGFRYGCGYWQTPPKVMAAIRELVLESDPSFQKAKRTLENQQIFSLEGDFYKRSRYPEQPEELRDWLDRKSISFIHNSKDFELLFSKDFCQEVAAGFRMLQPFYEFLRKAESRVPHEKTGQRSY